MGEPDAARQRAAASARAVTSFSLHCMSTSLCTSGTNGSSGAPKAPGFASVARDVPPHSLCLYLQRRSRRWRVRFARL